MSVHKLNPSILGRKLCLPCQKNRQIIKKNAVKHNIETFANANAIFFILLFFSGVGALKATTLSPAPFRSEALSTGKVIDFKLLSLELN